MASNKKKNKILWWIIWGGAAIMLFSSFTKPTITPEPTPQPNPTPNPGGNGNGGTGTGTGSGTYTRQYPIIYNKYHDDAKLLQFALMVDQDGIIGPKSLLALKTFLPEYTVASFRINSRTDLDNLITKIYQIRTGFPYGGFAMSRRVSGVLA